MSVFLFGNPTTCLLGNDGYCVLVGFVAKLFQLLSKYIIVTDWLALVDELDNQGLMDLVSISQKVLSILAGGLLGYIHEFRTLVRWKPHHPEFVFRHDFTFNVE
jgi:hypothetical protein